MQETTLAITAALNRINRYHFELIHRRKKKHKCRCNSPINLVKILCELDRVVNVQFPSIMLPSFRHVRLLRLTQSLLNLISLRALNRVPVSGCFSEHVWKQRVVGVTNVARDKNTRKRGFARHEETTQRLFVRASRRPMF